MFMKPAAVLRTSMLAALLAPLASAGVARAEDSPPVDDRVPMPDPDRPITGYVWLPEGSPQAAGGGAFSRTLFLEDCKPSGCQVNYGNTDSRTNTSSIPDGPAILDPFAGSAGDWAEFMDCMRDTFAPFDIDVTDVDPGTESHMEVMVAGHPNDLGLSSGIGGIAPYQCGYIYNSLSFAFSDVYGGDMIELCSTAAQEVAHTWGLDHSTIASDPMTYAGYNGQRSFKDQSARCGSDCPTSEGPDCPSGSQSRDCSCLGADNSYTNQNSVDDIISVFGASDPTPPIVEISSPANNAQVDTSFNIRADISDENGVARTELWIDNQMVEALNFPPYVYNAPASLADGTHNIEIRAFDTQDTMGSDEVTVILGEPCDIPGDCIAAGEGYTCVGGRCVPGQGVVGGLGTACESGQDCFSGICASDGTQQLCGEQCTLDNGDCPGGFGCLDDGSDGGICWPGIEEGGCGCSGTSPAQGAATLLFALGLMVLGRVGRRPRARAKA